MTLPTDAVWTMTVLSGNSSIPTTLFVLPPPSGMVVAKDNATPMTIPPDIGGSFEGHVYGIAEDDSNFTVWIDGSSRVLPLVSKTSKTSLSRPTSTPEQTGSISTAAQTGSISTATQTRSTSTAAQTGAKGVSTGVIAGIVVGVLVLLAVILGVVLLLLQRKKKQRATKGTPPREREGGESDKIFVEPEEAKDNPHDYRPQYTELPGNSQVQELYPASGEVTTFRANEMLGGNGQADELHDGQHTLPSHISESSFPPADVPASASASASAPAPSPYVEARKKVEISWLESEEAKLRQRREQLIMQNGGGEP